MPEPTIQVRSAQCTDAAACATIYAPYVTDTAITFELAPPTPEQMAQRIGAANETHAWLVATAADRVIGYAYAGQYKERAAYRWSCEVSVYLEQGRRRTGAGRTLYTALLTRLAERGYQMAVAGMTLPNPASEGLHRAVGFEPIGVYRRIGWKFGRWHDVAWLQRLVTSDRDAAVAPRALR